MSPVKRNTGIACTENNHSAQAQNSKWDFPGGSDSKASVYNVGDLGSIPGSGRPPGEGNGNPLQYSCLGNPMDRGPWWATVHGVERVRHDLATEQHTKI